MSSLSAAAFAAVPGLGGDVDDAAAAELRRGGAGGPRAQPWPRATRTGQGVLPRGPRSTGGTCSRAAVRRRRPAASPSSDILSLVKRGARRRAAAARSGRCALVGQLEAAETRLQELAHGAWESTRKLAAAARAEKTASRRAERAAAKANAVGSFLRCEGDAPPPVNTRKPPQLRSCASETT